MQQIFLISKKFQSVIQEYSKKWNVSDSEVLRILCGVGSIIIDELESGKELYVKQNSEFTKLTITDLPLSITPA